MATTSMWAVRKRLDHIIDYVVDEEKTIELQSVIDYASNKVKTMNHKYVSCINCMQLDPYASMMHTKGSFHDQREIVCFHGYQSFAEGEVTPQLAHQIGVELAEKLWEDRFEVVVTTHLNTDNIHNHIVVNATSFSDGKRYCNTKKDLGRLRDTSDELCRYYGLSVIEEKAYQGRDRNQYRHDESLRDIIKKDIDSIIQSSLTETQLFNQLEFEGYEIKITGGNIALRHPRHKRFVRLGSLGNGYQKEALRERILKHTRVPTQQSIYDKKGFDIMPFFHRYKVNQLTGLLRLYLHYQYLLGIIPKKNNTRPRYSKELKQAIRHLDELSDQTILLCTNRIETLEQLQQFQEPIEQQISDLMMKRQYCYNRIRRCRSTDVKADLKEEAKSYTPMIRELRSKIKLCDGIKARSTRLQKLDLENPVQSKTKGEK